MNLKASDSIKSKMSRFFITTAIAKFVCALFSLHFMLFELCTEANSYTDFYAECIKGYEFNNNNMNAIVLSPIRRQCQQRCAKECKAFSRKASLDDRNTSVSEEVELNDDVITNCMGICQNGEIFESQYLEAVIESTGNPPVQKIRYELRPPVKIGVACTDTMEERSNTAVRTSFTVRNGDKIKISITGADENSSKIYMCGKKHVKLTPIFPNMEKALNIGDSKWNNNNPPQTEWQSKSDHICFNKMSDNDFMQLSNQDLWSSKIGHTPCDWHARNPNYIDTGLYIADGDELNISWTGEYAYNKINNQLATRKLLVDCLRNPNTMPQAKSQCRDVFNNSSGIGIKDPKQSSMSFQDGTGPGYVVKGEEFRVRDDLTGEWSPDIATEDETQRFTKFNLSGFVTDSGITSSFNDWISGCDSDDPDSYSKPKCTTIDNPGISRYTLSGVLKDFSTSRTILGIRHHDAIGYDGSLDPNSYNNIYRTNHYGGYMAEVSWGGCPFSDGSQMQYTIFKENDNISAGDEMLPAIPENSWKDVPQDSLDPEGFIEITDVPDSGKLFIRIKPLDSNSQDPVIRDLYENPANRHGQYYILVERLEESGLLFKNGPLVKIIKYVTEIIMGKNRQIGEVATNGVIKILYNNVVSNSKFITAVQAFVSFYVVFLGLSFSLGLIKINNKEVTRRLLKIAFVLTVISPQSWEFFGGYLVPLCVDGTIQIIGSIIAGSYATETAGLNEAEIALKPYLLFETFDLPIAIMSSRAVWIKIVALLFNGLLGFVMVLALVPAMFIYLMSILKVTMIYLISLIMISLMIISAPIILVFMLFESTKYIFEQWGKQLISYTLQPVLCFTSITLFNFLLVMLIKIILSFTACPSCAIYINLEPLYEACWLPIYYPIFNTHLPEDASSGMGSIFGAASAILAFAIITHGGYIFTTYVSEITSLMVTGSLIGADISTNAIRRNEFLASRVLSFGKNNIMNAVKNIQKRIPHSEKALPAKARMALAAHEAKEKAVSNIAGAAKNRD